MSHQNLHVHCLAISYFFKRYRPPHHFYSMGGDLGTGSALNEGIMGTHQKDIQNTLYCYGSNRGVGVPFFFQRRKEFIDIGVGGGLYSVI